MNATLDIIDLEEVVSRSMIVLDRGATEGVSKAADIVAGEAKAHHRYVDRSGKLTESIAAQPAIGAFFTASGVHADVTADTPYAASIEKGSKPHIIRAKKAKALRFTFGVGGGHPGIGVFARQVNHPGTKAYKFLSEALERRLDDVTEACFADVLESLRDAGFSIER
jgi:hypothetical protein